ncbi:MAG: DUF3370 family protein [Myxococcota bacterium]
MVAKRLQNAVWGLGLGVCVGLGGACDAPHDLDPEPIEAPEDPLAGGKGDDLNSSTVTDPGALRWSAIAQVRGEPVGAPLFVSNNPEHVEGFGILAGVPYPGLSLRGAQRAPDAPEAQWSRQIVDERCPDGGAQEFGVYLAHILPADLGSGRRITLGLVAEDDATITVRGKMGTTDWSSGGQLLTTETTWLGAQLARSFFFDHDAPERTFEAEAGKFVEVDVQMAASLVEGRYHVESDTCLYPFTIAHGRGLGGHLPRHYAKGDVKWPGWYEGSGYGRAAGVYEADHFSGEQAVIVDEVPSVQGVGLLTPDDSFPALARHEDSAELLFGNYGVLYDHTLNLVNDTEACIEANVELVSYIDRNATPGRTPTVGFFEDTADAYTPSMFWNGPVRVGTARGQQLHHPVLHYAPTEAERAERNRAVASMRHSLLKVELAAGQVFDVEVELPVPGYIVAPIALTVHAQPCG